MPDRALSTEGLCTIYGDVLERLKGGRRRNGTNQGSDRIVASKDTFYDNVNFRTHPRTGLAVAYDMSSQTYWQQMHPYLKYRYWL